MIFQKTIISKYEKNICQAFILIMKHIFTLIKNKLQKLQKSTKKEIINLCIWIIGAYLGINLMSNINSFLLKFPNGLFFVLLLNFTITFYLSINTYFDILAIKIAFNKKIADKLMIYGIHTINQILFICFVGFNIYKLLCLINSF